MFVRMMVVAFVVPALPVPTSGRGAVGRLRAEPAPKASRDTRLKELLKERLATVKEIAAMTEKGYKAGQLPVGRVLEAARAVLRAELDLCESDKERVAVLEKMVKAAKQREEYVAEAARSAAVPARDVLAAKAERLEAEVALERAKQK